MKLIFTFLILTITCNFSMGQKLNPSFDSTMAMRLGADGNGMKNYVLVILKTGLNTVKTKSTLDSLFGGHMKNITRMVELKKLVVAGPLGKNGNGYRGIFILDVGTIDEAKQLMQSDPAVMSNLLFPEYYNWYGSAALPEYLKVSDKVRRYSN